MTIRDRVLLAYLDWRLVRLLRRTRWSDAPFLRPGATREECRAWMRHTFPDDYARIAASAEALGVTFEQAMWGEARRDMEELLRLPEPKPRSVGPRRRSGG